MSNFKNIICPNCGEALSRTERIWRCPNRHAFDQAKEGYLNLLLANKKKSKNPGDSKQMIQSRERFLETGAFDFLIDRLRTSINDLYQNFDSSNEQDKGLALDLACGSGFYTRRVFEERLFQRVGIDISKNATSIAARLDNAALYLVASVFNVPLADQQVDVILNIFAPLELKEIYRLLKEGGRLIKVVPDKNHMIEVSEMIYDEVTGHSSDFGKQVADFEGLQVVEQFQLGATVQLSAENLLDFISMTPFYYKFGEEELMALKGKSVTLGFVVYIVRK